MPKLRDFRDPLPSAAFAGFSQPRRAAEVRNPGAILVQHRENVRPAWYLREVNFSGCTKSGHPPVDRLHSIENRHLADAGF